MTERTRRERLAIPRQDMPTRAPDERVHDFGEVNTGFTAELARLEAARCLGCKVPTCTDGCPVSVDIREFVGKVDAGDFEGAARALSGDNCLPAVTGRVCPQETQCEAKCVLGRKGRPVAIGNLERFVADWAAANAQAPARPERWSGHAVAVVGSGPAGLTAAGELVRRGHEATVFEAFHVAGGVLVYGIPKFRLPRTTVAREVEQLERMGVRFEYNAVIGKTYTLDELRRAFDAVFVAVGAGLPVFLGIPGEELKGVYSANEYLTRINLMDADSFPDADTPVLRGDKVVVVGGGNVAVDAARTAVRLGADVTLAYRRTRDEMPARVEEIHHAEEEGVRMEFLVSPLAVEGDDRRWVTGLRCERMELGEPDASGRRRPVRIDGSEHVIACDTVIMAVGTHANPLLTSASPHLELNKWGNIVVGDTGMTSMPGVFAGGDIVRGAATVILAMGDGKRAAEEIDAYLSSGDQARGLGAPVAAGC